MAHPIAIALLLIAGASASNTTAQDTPTHTMHFNTLKQLRSTPMCFAPEYYREMCAYFAELVPHTGDTYAFYLHLKIMSAALSCYHEAQRQQQDPNVHCRAQIEAADTVPPKGLPEDQRWVASMLGKHTQEVLIDHHTGSDSRGETDDILEIARLYTCLADRMQNIHVAHIKERAVLM